MYVELAVSTIGLNILIIVKMFYDLLFCVLMLPSVGMLTKLDSAQADLVY